MPLQWINVSTSLPPYHVYTHSLLLTQASKAMMGKAISPLAASKHRKCVKATSRLVPSPCVCVSVWARERERKYVYAGYNIMLISVCIYACVSGRFKASQNPLLWEAGCEICCGIDAPLWHMHMFMFVCMRMSFSKTVDMYDLSWKRFVLKSSEWCTGMSFFRTFSNLIQFSLERL